MKLFQMFKHTCTFVQMHVFSTGPVNLHDSLNKIDYRFLICGKTLT